MNSNSKYLNRSDVASCLLRLNKDILKNWQNLCRENVEAAKAQTLLALIDSMPEFLDRLVETLRSPNPRNKAEENSKVALEHAEDRADQPEYTLDQVIVEYHLLRSVITELLKAEGVSDEESRKIIHEFIDRGISKAAVRYIELETSKQNTQNAEIHATKIEAEKASEAKSSFLANMSHEIRSPLGAIMGFVGLLKDSEISADEVSKYLSIIDRNSNHLLRIIDDILDLTKVEAGKMVVEKIEFHLLEFMADFSSLAGLRARENGIIFEYISENPLPEFVITDPTRLRQILSNVVGNAIKFTEKGRVELLVSYQDHCLQFKVIDTGRGISDEQRTNLFQAFSQADSSTTRRFGGTGLGLVLTKKLSQALGGDFRLVESEIGKGSIFQVNLPVMISSEIKINSVKDVENLSPKENKSEQTSELKGFEILLVEDSPDNQFLIERILNKTGAKVTIASNGAEGVQIALSKNFDVILMDIQMPVMDGHQAMQVLREKGYSGPVVALTAHAMKEERERAIASGFLHFLTKPIDRKTLTELLVRLLKPYNR
ncbi:MAG: response regulator [Bdellovibrio sp.]|nr:response regulator [Bdellovibrio sp.]